MLSAVASATQDSRFERLKNLKPPALPGDSYLLKARYEREGLRIRRPSKVIEPRISLPRSLVACQHPRASLSRRSPRRQHVLRIETDSNRIHPSGTMPVLETGLEGSAALLYRWQQITDNTLHKG